MLFEGLRPSPFIPCRVYYYRAKGAIRSEANGPRDHGVHQVRAPMTGSAPEPQHDLMSCLIRGEQARKRWGAQDDHEAPLYHKKGKSVSVDKRIVRYQ